MYYNSTKVLHRLLIEGLHVERENSSVSMYSEREFVKKESLCHLPDSITHQ